MQKIKLWFWIVSNVLGMGGYLWIASFLWTPIGEKIIYAGSPGFGDALIDVPCMLILFIFLIFNFATLRGIRASKNNTMLFIWFAFAGLWLDAVIYDGHRSPSFREPPNEISVQTHKWK